MNHYVIADIAGQYDALMRLVSKFEPGSKIYLLGDIVDRGPKSKEVVEWARTNPDVTCILGNHEHMLIDWITNGDMYAPEVWTWNGGIQTLESYFGKVLLPSMEEEMKTSFPKSHLNYLQLLAPYGLVSVNDNNFILTHAPIFAGDLETAVKKATSKEYWGFHNEFEYGILWNRSKPVRREGEIQIFGHNSHWGLTYFNTDDEPWAICLDDSRKNVLTALNLNTMKIIQEPYESVL